MSTIESPVVLSKFDNDGRSLCSVSVALNKQRVGVEAVHGGETLNTNFLYLEDSSLRVGSMRWSQISSTDTLCVFLGLNNGEIWIYSPAANEVVYKMSTGNSYEIKDMKISSGGTILWCIDSDDFFYKFDLTNFTLKDHFKIETCSQLSKLCLLPKDSSKILVASFTIFLVDVESRKVSQTYPGHVSPVTHLSTLNDDYFLSGAINDRFLNIYDIKSSMTKSVLVLQSNLKEVSIYNDESVAATTEDGDVEVFSDPLVSANTANNKRRGNNKSKQSNKKLHVQETPTKVLPVINVSIKKDILTICWLQNAIIPHFEQLKWQDLPLNYTLEVSSDKSGIAGKHSRSLYGTELSASKNYVEGNAKITSGDNFKHVNDAIKQWELEVTEQERSNDQDSDSNLNESLADKLEAASISHVQIGKKKNSTATTVGTVTVVLSQALQANDHSLLETVLNNRDERVIKDTIFRLKPPLAVILLERLAERIARQTHRQGVLNVWVKWCLIIHGGYLVTIPNLMSSLSSLHSTLKRRSDLLPRLLSLESRLEYALDRLSSDSLHEDEDNLEELLEEEFEEDVEYNEELDDAGLIEDGEEDEQFEDDEDEESDNDDSEERKVNGTRSDGLSKNEVDVESINSDEAGYSDVEMQ
ncbi:hypothetical protein HG535_0D04550 [Zygotorulaspora mrakii]|uniref:Small-subunit processome Utp12 domain-containing protein n=1 Tax=Zygotorulaspora mrakii TaxID=42260 RepID=A0A7H9B2U5_ZYGMR|nr:uncharacterized protein HG535_0D04550 [Zygotorulaspora mrakii]QLG72746.1 hypothetical protein HG535_0D04550 [Zygotorulaspora mrakii]